MKPGSSVRSLEVEEARRRPPERGLDLGARPHPDDAPVAHRDRLGARPGLVEGHDVAIDEDEVGRPEPLGRGGRIVGRGARPAGRSHGEKGAACAQYAPAGGVGLLAVPPALPARGEIGRKHRRAGETHGDDPRKALGFSGDYSRIWASGNFAGPPRRKPPAAPTRASKRSRVIRLDDDGRRRLGNTVHDRQAPVGAEHLKTMSGFAARPATISARG